MGTTLTVFLLLQFAFGTTLSIRVTKAGTHEPVPVAYIRVQKLGVMLQEVVAPDGRAEVPNLASGPYTLIVEAPGYETSYSEISLPLESFSRIELRQKLLPRPNSSKSGQPSQPGQAIRRIFRKLFR
jgi:hypothetical protein